MLLLLLSIAKFNQDQGKTSEWFEGIIGKGASINRSILPSAKSLSAMPTGSNHTVHVSDEELEPFESPEYYARRTELLARESKTYTLLIDGKIAEANRAFFGESGYQKARVYDGTQTVATCLLLDNRFQDALSLLSRDARLGQWQTGDYKYLLLSLASAGSNQVFPGQLKFCQKKIRDAYLSYHRTRFLEPLPTEEDPKTVAVQSCLALGYEASPAYAQFFELALKIDPTNQLAARGAMDFYGATGQISQMRRVIGVMKQNLKPGSDRDAFLLTERRILVEGSAP